MANTNQNGTTITLRVDIEDSSKDKNLEKFQKLLAYFVWHLEYLNGGFIGDKTEEPKEQTFLDDVHKKVFCQTGQGYLGHTIQDTIKDWELLDDGRVFITIGARGNDKGLYTTKDSYLHWAGFAGNASIYAEWSDKCKDDKPHITGLYIKNKWGNNGGGTTDNPIELSKLGIRVQTEGYDSFQPSPKGLEGFYDAFVKAKKLETTQRLKTAKNIIFTGAPGTGKTHLAKKIAELIRAQTEFVQFHPSYDYTDFVEGLRPVNNNNQIVFERKDGIFKAFCEKALKEKKKTPYVFIIDEINRGEISKIFGELFFSIDPGYRGKKGAVRTQYANLQGGPNKFDEALEKVLPQDDKGHFFIPENVYIIGTMNDIDRSVESMDFAFRRRFTFIEIKAKDTQLEILNSMQEAKAKDKIEALVKKMDSLNKAIYDPKNSTGNQYDLSEAYHIGAAYFKHYEDYAEQDKPFDKLWDNHLKGVLFEYLRGKPDANKILDNWKKAYAGGILSLANLNINDLQKALLNLKTEEEIKEIIAAIEACICEHIETKKEELQNKIKEQLEIYGPEVVEKIFPPKNRKANKSEVEG